jgi:predicted peptidase
VLFLHGAGEGGTDNLAQTKVGLGRAIRNDPSRFPLIGVFPQSPPRVPWRGASVEHAVRALEATLDEFNTDRDRVYLTGISMGGYGTLHLATAQPERFAAIVPVCGGSANPELTAERLATMPMWVFHGDLDNIIPVEESRDVVEALRARGSSVRYTEYEGVKHNSWDPAYAEPELIPWLLAQRKTR